jgi:hypothetical protein
VRAWTVDDAGLTSIDTIHSVQVDLVGPSVAASANPAPNSVGWLNSATTVTFTTQADGATVTSLCISSTGAQSAAEDCTGSTGSQSVIVTAEGSTDLTATVTDAAGRTMSETVTVRLDTTQPTVTATFDRPLPASGWYTEPVTLTLTAADPAGSGIASLCFRDNDAPANCDASSTVGLSITGLTSITYWTVDLAGNATTPVTVAVPVDSDAPTASIALDLIPSVRDWFNAPVTATLSGTDVNPSAGAGSGIVEVCVTLTGAQAQPETCVDGTDTSVSIDRQGITTLSVVVRDAAGHASAPTTRLIRLDTAKPYLTDGPLVRISEGVRIAMNGATSVELRWDAFDRVPAPRMSFSTAEPPVIASGIVKYQLVVSSNDGASWERIWLASPTATRATTTLQPGVTYRFRVNAMDAAGNWSGWRSSGYQSIALLDQADSSVHYGSGWWTTTNSLAWSGSFAATGKAGTTARLLACGEELAWLALRRPDGGTAAVYVDGSTKPVVVDLSAAGTQHRRVVFSRSFDDGRCHSLRIVVTSGRVTLDGFIVRDRE